MELMHPLMAPGMEALDCGVREEKGRGGGDGGVIRGALIGRRRRGPHLAGVAA